MNRRMLLLSLCGIAGVAGLGAAWGSRKGPTSPPLYEGTLEALRIRDRSASDRAVSRLFRRKRKATIGALVKAMDHPEDLVRVRAARAISMHHAAKDVSGDMARHLLTNPSEGARVSCAIGLMSVYTPAVREAYIRALDDKADRVVRMACGEVAYRGGAGAAEALSRKLDHPSWRVRLEVCKGLIVLKAADGRVVKTLEDMSKDPEAAVYDAEIDEFNRIDQEVAREMGPLPEEAKGWGKIGEILAQARQVASKK